MAIYQSSYKNGFAFEIFKTFLNVLFQEIANFIKVKGMAMIVLHVCFITIADIL